MVNNKLDLTEDSSELNYIGPGTWRVIHTTSFHARTEKEKESFICIFQMIIHNFFCKLCSNHAKKYLQENPMTSYKNLMYKGEPLGLFIWTYKFHNFVNIRLNKKVMKLETVMTFYKNMTDNCSQKCMDSK